MENLQHNGRDEEFAARNTFAARNGMALVALGKDRAAFQMEVGPESYNPMGIVHGGALFTLADCAAGMAARTDGRTYVTQNATLHFIRAQNRGVARAEATLIHRGRSTCLFRVEVTDDSGRLTAEGEFTFFCVSDKA